jgi:hypothetical protein
VIASKQALDLEKSHHGFPMHALHHQLQVLLILLIMAHEGSDHQFRRILTLLEVNLFELQSLLFYELGKMLLTLMSEMYRQQC